MKNKLLVFLIICLIAMPAVGNVNKNGATKVTVKKQKENKYVSNLTKPRKIKLNISARILFASKTVQKNKKSAAQLKKSEKELTGYLDYNDYKLIKSGSKTVKLKKSFKIRFSQGGFVKITPQSYENGRIRAKVVWHVPGKSAWSTTLNFKKGKRSIISGPKDKNGGMYLMSLEIN